jgi:hypothetical protein
MRLTVIPMGYTNSLQIMYGDMGHILQDEILEYTQHFVDDVPIKGPPTRYELPDGGYKTIPKNSGIRRFIWELCLATNRILQCIKAYGGTFNGKKSFIGLQEAVIVRHLCMYKGQIPEADHIQKIVSWPIPTLLTEVQAFLGMCGVVRIFIKDFALIAQPLVNLTRKDVLFKFGEEEEESIE